MVLRHLVAKVTEHLCQEVLVSPFLSCRISFAFHK